MYTDLLIRIKNAQKAKKETVKAPYSNFDYSIAEVLEKSKFVESVSKKGRAPKRMLEIKLKYKDGQGIISDIKLISKPSRRIFGSYKDFKSVKHGYGVVVVSTPKGAMTTMQARKEKVGGQLLFEIW